MRILFYLWMMIIAVNSVHSQSDFLDYQELLKQAIPIQEKASELIPKTGSFKLPSKVFNNPEVTCYWATMVDLRGNPGPKAHHVVAYFMYPVESEWWKGKSFNDWLNQGYTVFGLYFKDVESDKLNYRDREKCYYFPESNSDETWKAAYEKVLKELNLPRMKFFATGVSGGMSAAHYFTMANPDLVEACAGASGTILGTPTEGSAKVPCLIINNRGDYSYSEGESGQKRMIEKGGSPLFIQGIPLWETRGNDNWHHPPNPISDDLIHEYLNGIAELRDANAGVLPPYQKWPLAVSINDLTKVVDPSKKDPFSIFKKEEISFIPNLKTYQTAAKIIFPIESRPIDDYSKVYFVRCAPAAKRKGIILYIANTRWSDLNLLSDEMNFLADQGWDLFLAETSPLEGVNSIQRLLTIVEKEPRNKEIPIHLLITSDRAKEMEGEFFKNPMIKNLVLVDPDRELFEKISGNFESLRKDSQKILVFRTKKESEKTGESDGSTQNKKNKAEDFDADLKGDNAITIKSLLNENDQDESFLQKQISWIEIWLSKINGNES